ncbi:MAG: PDZ domain-containing protein [Pirellula sp.]
MMEPKKNLNIDVLAGVMMRIAIYFCSLGYVACAAISMAAAEDIPGTRLVSQPAISQRHIAFAYDRDLWIADRDGQNPRRLTSHDGAESSPCFSPDGSLIAFTGEYDGNTDVFVVPIQGGAPKRLTWHPAQDLVECFTPDGKAIIFSSPRQVFTSRYTQLFSVPVKGGFPEMLPIPNGLRAAVSPDGNRIAYIPIAERMTQWKNYRGGTTSRIWIYNKTTKAVQQIRQPDSRCNDTDPVWIGNQVYFRSDRNGEFNVFMFDPSTEAIEQRTHHNDFHVNRLEGGSDRLIYEQAGYLHVMDPMARSTTQLKIHVTSDVVQTRTRWVSGPEWIRNFELSPSGARAVFEYRGDILTLPASKGDARSLTSSSASHERSPIWSPDGSKIAYFSDSSGEYRLYVVAQDGSGASEAYDLNGAGFYDLPRWSPDGTKISYRDNSWSLYVLDLAKKSTSKVVSAVHYAPSNLNPLHHRWSPDSRWLAYSTDTKASMQQVMVYNIDEAKSYPISDGLSDVSEPVFDRSGKYLYFVASTDAGPVKNWFDMSNADMESVGQIYVVVLNKNDESPLKPESDEESGSKPTNKESKDSKDSSEATKKETGSEEVKRVLIDFERLDQRILSLGLPNGDYSELQAGNDGNLYFLQSNLAEPAGEGPRGAKLVMYSIKSKKPTTLLEGVMGFRLSHDAKKLIYQAGTNFGIAAASGKIDSAESRLSIDKIQTRVDPRAEWQQVFDEVWRINRDYFYDPKMHGADWNAMKAKYQQFVPHLATRSDLNRVMVWMCSELAVGHHRVGGGDEPVHVQSVPGGLLGCDYRIENGRYRFAKVLGGLNWNGPLRAPLTEPGVSATEGEYLLEVDGVELTDKINVYSLFENKSGKSVKIKIGPNADGSQSRHVTVVPIADESALRNRDWVERNLKRVTDATKGRVAYVYVPNTTNLGHTYFKRYFFPQANRDAIIVDERFNGGGQVADYYIDLLRRPYLSHWATRYGQDLRTPSAAILGPKVMIIDETAGSGGDLLPWMFRKLQLGTLVGKRTWGGLVGILGFPTLIDGGGVTAPNLAIWTDEGFVVENEGVPPDVEVEQWPADVMAGKDPQLEKAIEIALKQLESNPPVQHKKPNYPKRVR